MANNRMLLIHRPTGLAIVIAKHMGAGWGVSRGSDTMQLLFDTVDSRCEEKAEMEDFCLGMESCEAVTSFVSTDWSGYYQDEREPKLLQVNERGE